jgi:predicted hydrolase (HD superfamily)
MNADAAWAREIARDLLAESLPRRWAHTQGVARKARDLAPLLGDQAELLEAAAWLHDIGYSPDIAMTGFHPLDGARYLRDVARADDVLRRLVAGHSCAVIEARERGLAEALGREFPPADAYVTRALIYCDMTTTPDGEPVDVAERLAEIRERYGPVHLVTRFTQLAEPHLVGAVQDIQEMSRLVGLAL